MKTLGIIQGKLPDRYFIHSYLSQPCITCADNSLCSIRHLQFAENIRDVIAHGLQAEYQLSGNLLICTSLGDQGKNL